MPEPFIRDEIGVTEFNLNVEIWSDGTNTIANITDEEDRVVAIGNARRRKGDRRDQTLGNALAVSRACADLAHLVAVVGVTYSGADGE